MADSCCVCGEHGSLKKCSNCKKVLLLSFTGKIFSQGKVIVLCVSPQLATPLQVPYMDIFEVFNIHCLHG